MRNFLFNGIDELGSKSFLDYFPEYRCEDGTVNERRSMVSKSFLDYFPEYRCEDGAVNERRSMVSKSFETRPWDTNGEFIGKLF